MCGSPALFSRDEAEIFLSSYCHVAAVLLNFYTIYTILKSKVSSIRKFSLSLFLFDLAIWQRKNSLQPHLGHPPLAVCCRSCSAEQALKMIVWDLTGCDFVCSNDKCYFWFSLRNTPTFYFCFLATITSATVAVVQTLYYTVS